MASTTMALGIIHGISPEIHKQTGVVSPLDPGPVCLPRDTGALLQISHHHCRRRHLLLLPPLMDLMSPSNTVNG